MKQIHILSDRRASYNEQEKILPIIIETPNGTRLPSKKVFIKFMMKQIHILSDRRSSYNEQEKILPIIIETPNGIRLPSKKVFIILP